MSPHVFWAPWTLMRNTLLNRLEVLTSVLSHSSLAPGLFSDTDGDVSRCGSEFNQLRADLASWMCRSIFLSNWEDLAFARKDDPQCFCWDQLTAPTWLILFGPSAACPTSRLWCRNLASPSITEVQARSTNAWCLMHEGLDPNQSVQGLRFFFSELALPCL